MKTGSLCSGYEGFALALEETPAWVADNDPDASKVLAHRFPDVPNLGDITKVDWLQVKPVELLTAGFPCQDISNVGKGDAEWVCIRASAVGAPHSRRRWFCFATNSANNGYEWSWAARPGRNGSADRRQPASDTDSRECRLGSRPTLQATPDRGSGSSHGNWGTYAPAIRRWEDVLGRPAPRPTEPGRTGERLAPRFVEWMMGLPEGWVTDVPQLSRNAQLRLLGNGIVPQQAALAWTVLNRLRAAA